MEEPEPDRRMRTSPGSRAEVGEIRWRVEGSYRGRQLVGLQRRPSRALGRPASCGKLLEPAIPTADVTRGFLVLLDQIRWTLPVPRRVSSGPIAVPRVSEFYGIIITMYYNDHAPPHFHAQYAEHGAQLVIDSLELLEGSLPPRALTLVRDWATIHGGALRANWDAARRGEPLVRIPGLQ